MSWNMKIELKQPTVKKTPLTHDTNSCFINASLTEKLKM